MSTESRRSRLLVGVKSGAQPGKLRPRGEKTGQGHPAAEGKVEVTASPGSGGGEDNEQGESSQLLEALRD